MATDECLPFRLDEAEKITEIEKENFSYRRQPESSYFLPEIACDERVADDMSAKQMEKHQEKVSLIVLADTRADEEAVMIVRGNASLTEMTMMRTSGSVR